MRHVAWLLVAPVVVALLPWFGAWVTHGRVQAVWMGGLWLVCLATAVWVAFGPGLLGWVVLAIVQLARTPWRPPAARSDR